MHLLNLKLLLTICLIINCLAYVSAQKTRANNTSNNASHTLRCDTLVLKDGQIQLAKIYEIGKDFISFYDCLDGKFNANTSLSYIRILNVDTIKKAPVLPPAPPPPPIKYKFVASNSKYYIEGTMDITLPFIAILLNKTNLITDNTLFPFLGMGYTLSAGYQFKPYLGVGLTTKNYVLIDYSSWTINSLLADYRLDFGKNKLFLHAGYVTNRSYFVSEGCTIELDKSQYRPTYGLSIKKIYKASFCLWIRSFLFKNTHE